MNKKIFVKNITSELTQVNDYFIVTKKGIYPTKNNKRFIGLNLRDMSGSIEAKIWEDKVDLLKESFEENDLVYIESRLEDYHGKLQLIITNMSKVENTPLERFGDFYPVSTCPERALRERYENLVGGICNPHLSNLFRALKKDEEMLEEYFLFPASIGVHHMYIGGLIEHSISIAEMGKAVVTHTGGDIDIIVAGCLLHDIGKIEEMMVRGGFKYSDRGRLLGHIALGVMILEDIVKDTPGFPDALADILSHIIVSHHGLEEWGSPRKPMCIEALIVHYLDNLDAKLMGVQEHMKENMEDERWTGYHRLYESRFYKTPENE